MDRYRLHNMKRHHIYEAAAAALGLLGAVVLVSGLMPFINPGLLDLHKTGEYSPGLAFLVPTLFSLPLLGGSWHFNKKAREIRGELRETPRTSEAPWQRRLLWIVFGIPCGARFVCVPLVTNGAVDYGKSFIRSAAGAIGGSPFSGRSRYQ
jgi:hypothetical protein